MRLPSRRTLPAQGFQDFGPKNLNGNSKSLRVSSPEILSRSVTCSKSLLTNYARSSAVTESAMERQIQSLYRQQAYKDARGKEQWRAQTRSMAQSRKQGDHTKEECRPCFGKDTDIVEENTLTAQQIIGPIKSPDDAQVTNKFTDVENIIRPSFGDIMTAIFTEQELGQMTKYPRWPELLLRMWLDDLPLRASSADHLEFQKELLVQVFDRFDDSCLTVGSEGQLTFFHPLSHPCGCSGGAVWRARLAKNPRAFSPNSLLNHLKAWMDCPRAPPLIDSNSAEPELEFMMLQYMGECHLCESSYIVNGCPKCLIGCYLAVSLQPSKPKLRNVTFRPVRLQKLTVNFDRQSSLFTVYKYDRRKGRCNLFSAVNKNKLGRSFWDNHFGVIPPKEEKLTGSQCSSTFKIHCLLETTKACLKFESLLNQSQLLPPILSTRLLPSKSAIQSFATESEDPLLFLMSTSPREFQQEYQACADITGSDDFEEKLKNDENLTEQNLAHETLPVTRDPCTTLLSSSSPDLESSCASPKHVLSLPLRAEVEFKTPKTSLHQREQLTFRSPA